MGEQQFEGRSAAEAAIKACEVLGTTRSALKYKVVSETGEHLERRVVIAVEAAARPAPLAAGAVVAHDGDAEEAASPRPPRPSRDDGGSDEGRSRRSSSGGRGGRREGGREGGREAGRADRGERGGRAGGRRGGGRDRAAGGRGPAADDGIEALLKLDAANVVAPPRRPAIAAASPRASRALTTVTELLRLMSLKLDVTLVGDDEAELHIDMFGADEARIIGRKGEVLLALQFVLNRMLSRDEDESEQVAVLDAGGYRERRRVALEQLARKLAERAVQESKAVRLSPMSAHDRRVFHMALKTVEGITTRSEGDGLLRNLLIIPADLA